MNSNADEFDGVKDVVLHVYHILSRFAETKTQLDAVPLSPDALEVSYQVVRIEFD